MIHQFPHPKWKSRNEQMAALTGAKPAIYPSIGRLKAVPGGEFNSGINNIDSIDRDLVTPTAREISHALAEIEQMETEE